jgi:hypothetical protein
VKIAELNRGYTVLQFYSGHPGLFPSATLSAILLAFCELPRAVVPAYPAPC